MLTVMTWNLENLQRPAAGGDIAGYRRKLAQLVDVIAGVDPDLVGVQEVLAAPTDLAPASFADLRQALTQQTGDNWNGVTSTRRDQRGIRVGWLGRGTLTQPLEVNMFPPGVPPVTVDDTGVTITAARRAALAVTYTRSDGLRVDALTAHLKSKLLSFPGRSPDQQRFTTIDESERARYGLYALGQRAAEAATARFWATSVLASDGTRRNVLVCGDLNDTPEAATTQLLLGPPGSQIGTGGFDQADRGDAQRLWNLAPAMPAGDPATGIPCPELVPEQQRRPRAHRPVPGLPPPRARPRQHRGSTARRHPHRHGEPVLGGEPHSPLRPPTCHRTLQPLASCQR